MTYLDLPVFPLVADLGESMRRTLNYEPEVTDIGFGAQPAMPVQASTQERMQIVTVAPDADALDAVEAFFAARSGRFKAFWLATDAEDVTVLSASVLATVFIEASTFSDWSHLKGKHLVFRSLDGQCLFRKVLLVEPTAFASRSQVTLDEALPVNADCWQVSRLLLVRLSSDEIEYDFEADNHARICFTGIELPEEYAAPNALATCRPVYLYRITRRYGVRDIYSLHLTSHDTPVNSGVIWHPVPIDHSGLSVSTEGDTDKLNLELFAWEGNPFEDWLPIHIGQPTGIVLSLAHIDETTGLVLEAPAILFRASSNPSPGRGIPSKPKRSVRSPTVKSACRASSSKPAATTSSLTAPPAACPRPRIASPVPSRPSTRMAAISTSSPTLSRTKRRTGSRAATSKSAPPRRLRSAPSAMRKSSP